MENTVAIQSQALTQFDPEIFKGYKIVIVDDDILNAELLKLMLGDYITDFLYFSNGLEAINYLNTIESGKVFMFLDLNMPMVDGYGVIEHVAKMENKKNVRILVMSSILKNIFYQHPMATQVESFINKPFSKQVLLNALTAL